MSATAQDVHGPHAGYRHEALLYDGLREFVRRLVPFVREGLARDEPTLLVLPNAKIGPLREALGADAERVHLADMDCVGRNPGRIIPAWQEFLERHGRAPRLRGVGEPIGPRHSREDLVERHRHEALLNVAFAESDLTLLCAYDVGALDRTVIDEACRTHPFVRAGGWSRASDTFAGEDALVAPSDLPLPPPPPAADGIAIALEALSAVRRYVQARAAQLGLAPARDLVLAADELAANSVRHGGGSGDLLMWREHDAIVCEVRDRGRIEDPLAGRRRPGRGAPASRGLWLANQLCDLVQVRALCDGGVVRLHMRLDG